MFWSREKITRFVLLNDHLAIAWKIDWKWGKARGRKNRRWSECCNLVRDYSDWAKKKWNIRDVVYIILKNTNNIKQRLALSALGIGWIQLRSYSPGAGTCLNRHKGREFSLSWLSGNSAQRDSDGLASGNESTFFITPWYSTNWAHVEVSIIIYNHSVIISNHLRLQCLHIYYLVLES